MAFEDAPLTLLVIELIPARSRATVAAAAEAVALLADLGARPSPGGPLAERGGVVWLSLPEPAIPEAEARVQRLGYASAVSMLAPGPAPGAGRRVVRWRHRPYALLPLYEADLERLHGRDPHRRDFLLLAADGSPRRVSGYRGGAAPLAHRALPACDARLLVNLVFKPEPGVLLDPFAGAGGVVLEARDSGWTVISSDVDGSLRRGLAELADAHLVADAAALPLDAGTVDAVATEPPYHPSALGSLLAALGEARRVLRPGGRLAMLVHQAQRQPVLRRADQLGFQLQLDSAIERKGIQVAALAFLR